MGLFPTHVMNAERTLEVVTNEIEDRLANGETSFTLLRDELGLDGFSKSIVSDLEGRFDGIDIGGNVAKLTISF